MAFLLAVVASAGALVGTITTHVVNSISGKKEKKQLNEQITQLENQLMLVTKQSEESNNKKEDAEAKFFQFQEAYRVEQMKREEYMKKEKQELEKAQTERERSMEKRHEEWERKQNELNEAEIKHQRRLAKEAEEGLNRSHVEFERQMALERKRLAKEEELLTNAHLQHERCLENERERIQQSEANNKRRATEDRERQAHQMKIFAEAQKKWDDDRVVLEQNYDKLQSKLNEACQQSRRDQKAMEERLKCMMDNLMDEHKNLTVFEKVQKLKDLTDTFRDYCEMYANDPDKLLKETELFQRKFKLQLKKVQNSIKTGDKSLPWLDVWKDGSVLDMKMLCYLNYNGVIKREAIQAAGQQHQRDMGTLVSNFNASNALPCNVEELRAIENSFHDQFQEMESYVDRALPESTSHFLAIQAPTTTESRILSSARAECAVGGGGVLTVPPGVKLESGILTKNDDASQLSGSDNWVRCDAIAQSLLQSLLEDQLHGPGNANSTRSDALVESLQQPVFKD